MAFQPPINDFSEKSQKKLAEIAENPQYFQAFIVFNKTSWCERFLTLPLKLIQQIPSQLRCRFKIAVYLAKFFYAYI